MKARYWFFLMIVMPFCLASAAMAQKRNKLTLAEDHLIIQLDLHSSKASIDSVLKLAGISDIRAENILRQDFSALRRVGWNINKQDGDIIQLDISLADLDENPQSKPYLITKNLPNINSRPGYPVDEGFGVNNFAHVSIQELPSGLTRFFLPGRLNAKRVFLSGSFNDWSTLKSPMSKCDSGWMKDLSLAPGVYAYKFIVDGRWIVDPGNNLRENDGAGNLNSLYYRYNFAFRLQGFTTAKNVTLSGSFNGFNPDQLNLYKTKTGWERHLYLHEGAYVYHYRVDGKFITDPANPISRKDSAGNVLSVLNLGTTINFKLKGHLNARKVVLSGTFNHWDKEALEMKKQNNMWVLPYTLSAGNYDYKFIVDGKWVPDLANPNQSGTGEEINSFLSIEPNYVFKLKGYPQAKTVRLAGTFNDWNFNGYTLTRIIDGWQISMHLKPGKYLYKFIVDGNWILDPGNKLWEQNQFHTGNSVLWME